MCNSGFQHCPQHHNVAEKLERMTEEKLVSMLSVKYCMFLFKKVPEWNTGLFIWL